MPASNGFYLHISYRGWADFNATRRFYRYLNDVGEYLDEMADAEQPAEIHSVTDLLDGIENESLYWALLAVDKRTL